MNNEWKPGNGNPGGVIVSRAPASEMPEHEVIVYRVRECDQSKLGDVRHIPAADLTHSTRYVRVEVKPDLAERAKHNPQNLYFSETAKQWRFC